MIRYAGWTYLTLALVAIISFGFPAPAPAADIPIGTGTTTSTVPFTTINTAARTQVIYLAGEIGAAYLFDAISLNVTTFPAVRLNNLAIRMKHTDKTSFPVGAWESADWTTVYQGNPQISATGWTRFNFNAPFYYDGVNNLMVDISFDNSEASTGANGVCQYTALSDARMVYATGTNLGDPLTWSGTPGTRNQILNIKLQVPSVATPAFSPDAGTYATMQYVFVTCTTPGAEMHLTTNGVEPTLSDPIIASGSVVFVDSSMTLKARAWAPLSAPSAIKSAAYVLTPVATPTFNPVAGTYGTVQNVVISCATSGAEIHYTLNGAEPTLLDPAIPSGSSVPVNVALTLKAKAWKPDCVPSQVATAVYQFLVATPTVSADSGTYSTLQNVAISCATPEAVIRYTLNGADPTTSDPIIASGGTVLVANPMTLKAKAWRDGWTTSATKTATYAFTVSTPTFNPDGGAYSTVKIVTVDCASPDVEIRYTLNGVDPVLTDASIVAGDTLTIDRNQTLRAKAWRDGWTPSAIKTAVYAFTTAAPTFTPDAGTYTSSQNVIVSCSTVGSTIRYTTNGVDPTTTDPVIEHGSAVPITQTTTLKARAWRPDWPASTIKTAVYTLTPVATPTFSPVGGTYTSAQDVTVTCTTAGATIYYTTNGLDPTTSDAVIASGSVFPVSQSLTLKAKAFKTDSVPSSVATAVYQLSVATPVFAPDAAVYATGQTVKITCTTAGATIRITTNGVDPTINDPEFISGDTINIELPLTLKAKAWKDGWTPSSVKSGAYAFTTATPVFAPDAGAYPGPQQVVVTCASPGAVIRYTTNGVDPIETDDEIVTGTAIPVDHAMTLRARAWKTGWTTSAIKTAAYAFTVATPTFSPDAGSYVGTQNVVINCATTDAEIHYTTNGTDPTMASPSIAAGGSVAVSQSLTLKARAWKTNYTQSAIKSAAYTMGKAYYVKPTGLDGYDGRSWATAKRTIAAGLAAAASGDQVWVLGDSTQPYLERITLKDGVGLYGGFHGTETQLTQRNIAAYVTIIDGSSGGTVVTVSSGTTTTRIDGFTIRNGSGGGIRCSSASPTIANNTITACTADRGGGIYCTASSAVLFNNTVTGNSVTSTGGGIYFFSDPSYSPTIANNIIVGNTANSYGGGLYCCYPANVRNNTIVGNTGSQGGGIYSPSNPTLRNNIVVFNSSGIAALSAATLRNNCVYNPAWYNYSGGVAAGVGDISVDPRFSDRANGDYHLSPASLCIDAGYDAAVPAGSLDMDGQDRIQGTHVDIGADETDPGAVSRIVFVHPAGADANSGLSWAAAKRTITAALSVAKYDDQVWVKGDASYPYVERITLKDGVALYGGFSGVETLLDQRDIALYETIIDGAAAGSVVTVPAGASTTSRLDGFTIRNGSAESGGGIYCTATSAASIARNQITQNNASVSGGGIYCTGASPTINRNQITGNAAPTGAGVCCAAASAANLADNVIWGNLATLNGGAIACLSSTPSMLNNTIAENSADNEGGAVYCDASSANIWNNLLFDNHAALNAGGICCRNSSSAAVVNNSIVGNTTGGDGGGIFCDHSTPTLSNNIIAFNSSGIFQAWGPPALFNNCLYNPDPDGYEYYGMIPGVSDLMADPRVDREHGTLHLVAGSPCIDAGDDLSIAAGWIDMDDQPRKHGAHVDIGADESDGVGWTVPVVYVRTTGDDANAGTSWALAKQSVQAGIDAAAAVGGDVWVAAGTYSANLALESYTYLYGGFAGTETQRTERNWSTNATVLDAGWAGNAMLISGSWGTVDGFTIQNGYASNGGGISCIGVSHFTIAHNILTANAALEYGGAIDCDASSPVIIDNVIAGNQAARGGAIRCYHGSPEIANNTIIDNHATLDAAAVLSDDATPVIANNIVAFNAGGFLATGSGTPVLHHNVVHGNTAFNYSGIIPGTGDLSVDPQLVDRVAGDLRLARTSPCFNAGWNGVSGLTDLDLDGAPRKVGRVVDIGAYELVACAADFDLDGDADTLDLDMFSACAAGPGMPLTAGCTNRDFDRDGDADAVDFAIFQRCWSGAEVPADPHCMDD